MSEEPVQGPDYVAACDFLAFVSRYVVILAVAIVLSDKVRAASPTFFVVLFLALWTSDMFWGFAARTMERRGGQPGRSVRGIVSDTAIFWSVTALAAFLASWVTGSDYATLAVVIVAQIAVSAAMGVRREGMRR